jgi:hypothetical protein
MATTNWYVPRAVLPGEVTVPCALKHEVADMTPLVGDLGAQPVVYISRPQAKPRFSASQANQFPSRSGSPVGLSIGQSDEAKGRMSRRAPKATVAIRPRDTIPLFAPGARESLRTQGFLATSYPPFDPL